MGVERPPDVDDPVARREELLGLFGRGRVPAYALRGRGRGLVDVDSGDGPRGADGEGPPDGVVEEEDFGGAGDGL